MLINYSFRRKGGCPSVINEDIKCALKSIVERESSNLRVAFAQYAYSLHRRVEFKLKKEEVPMKKLISVELTEGSSGEMIPAASDFLA